MWKTSLAINLILIPLSHLNKNILINRKFFIDMGFYNMPKQYKENLVLLIKE